MRRIMDSFRDFWVALATTWVAFLLSLWVGTSGYDTAFALYVATVIVSGYWGGMRGGVLATALSACYLVYQYRSTGGDILLGQATDLGLSVVLFVLLGLLVSYLSCECLRALKLSTRLQNTLKTVPDAVVLTDVRGRISFLNPTAEALTLWQHASAVNKPVEKIVRLLDESARRPLKVPPSPTAAGAAYTSAALLVARDGTEKPIEYWAEPLSDAAGNALGLVLFLRDVSQRQQGERERKQREELFRSLTAYAADGLLLLDQNARCVYSNPACQAVGGFTLEEAQGNGWARFVHPEDQQVVAEWTASARQGKSYAREFRFQDPRGVVRWVRLRANPARSEDGQWLGHVGTIEDISQRINLEHTLAEHRKAELAWRQAQQEQQNEAAQTIAEMESVRVLLHKEREEGRRVQEDLRRELAERQATWKRVEEMLRLELAELTGKHGQVQEELTESRNQQEMLGGGHQRAHEELAERRRAEERLRQELAELASVQQRTAEQAAQAKQRAEQELRQRQAFLRRVLEDVKAGIVVWEGQGGSPVVNQTARLFLDLPHDGAPVEPWDQHVQWFGPDGKTALPREETPFVRALHHQPFHDVELVVRTRAGAVRTLFTSGTALRDPHGADLGFVLTLHDVSEHRRTVDELRDSHQSERKKAEKERARWRTERDQHGRALKRAEFLAEAGRTLAAALHYEDTLRNIARLAVPVLGGACVVQELQDADVALPVAVAVDGGAAGVQVWNAGTHATTTLPGSHTSAQLALSRQATFYAQVPDTLGAELGRTVEQALLHKLAPASALCVPLLIGGEPKALLTLMTTDVNTPYSKEDLALAEEFGRVASSALSNAAYHRDVDAHRARFAQKYQFIQSILTALEEGVCVLDEEGAITFANPAALRLLAWPETELVGKRLDDVVDDAAAHGLACAAPDGSLWQVLSSQHVLRKEHVAFRRGDGALLAASCTVSAFGQQDQAEGAVVVFQDVSGRLQREKEFQRRMERLNQASLGAEGLLDRLTDHVRPRLVQMRQAAGELRQDLPGYGGLLESAEVLDSGVHHLTMIFDGLWVVTRLARQALRLDRQPLELSTLLNRVVASADPVLKSRGHHLTVSFPLEPAWVVGDTARLEQMLAVLLDNATRYTRPGGAIVLTAERQPHDIVFRVKDNGIGIPVQELPRLSALSASAKRFWTHGGDGLGIGLALVRSVAELHGGQLTVTSEGPNQGSEFVVRLPALPPEPLAAEPEQKGQEWQVLETLKSGE